MNTIIKNYNLQIKKFQKIEFSSSETEIHDKRVILRRIFPILAVYKIKPSKVKNGEKAFKLFGKLRDIQVQILKLESIDQTPEIMKYLAFLSEDEKELKEKVRRFCKKKELEFPTIKKKSTLEKSKVIGKTNKSLNKLIEIIQSRSIDDAEDIHKIRIEFKKFRYKVEILSYIEDIDDSKLEMLKMYQDKLGDIQDFEVLITGIKKYCKKRKLDADEMTELFEHDQNTLIENFDNQIELFIAVCKDVLILDKEPESSANTIHLPENSGLVEDKPELTKVDERTTSGEVSKIIDSLVTTKNKDTGNDEATPAANDQSIENIDAEVIEGNQVPKTTGADSLKAARPNSKKKPVVENNVPVDSNQPE